MPLADLESAAEALAGCRWARLGEAAVVSRQVHGHGAPGDRAVGVYLGADAGQNLYGLSERGQVLHVDVLHRPGRVEPARLRARLREAARAFLRLRGEPGDETARLLRGVEARVQTQGELGGAMPTPRPFPGDGRPSGRTPAASPPPPPPVAGHIHLAFRAGVVPLEFVPLAVAAAEEAARESGLAPLCLERIDPCWESPLRPPCACGTDGGPAPAGEGSALRGAGPAVPDLAGPAAAAAAAGLDPLAAHALSVADPDPASLAALRARGLAVAAPRGRGLPALTAEGRVLRAALRRVSEAARRAGARAGPTPGARPRREPRQGVGRSDGLLHPTATAAAAALRGGPVRVGPGDLRFSPRAPRAPADALLALDRSPSMRAALPAAAALAESLRRAGRAVALRSLDLDPELPGGAGSGWLREARALRAALDPLVAETAPGGTDLARGLSRLAAELRTRPRGRRLVCYIFTDGLATLGPAEAGPPFAAALGAARGLRCAGVRTVFCGRSAWRARLAALAEAAGGRVRLVD